MTEERQNINKLTKQERDKIILDNTGLIYKISGKYKKLNPNIDLDDLNQEGYVALIKAVDNFDETKQNKFSTFAYTYIDYYIRNFISKQSALTLPKKLRKQINKINYIETIETNKLGHIPSDEYIANKMNISLDKYSRIKSAKQNINILSIQNEIGNTDIQLEEAITYNNDDNNTNEYDEIIENIGNKQIVDKVLFYLNSNQKAIMKLHYIQGMTMDEIAKKYNTSRQNIYLIIKKSIARIKEYCNLNISEVF
jgi:RNA polymerase sigma factor (sigma-70 family)